MPYQRKSELTVSLKGWVDFCRYKHKSDLQARIIFEILEGQEQYKLFSRCLTKILIFKFSRVEKQHTRKVKNWESLAIRHSLAKWVMNCCTSTTRTSVHPWKQAARSSSQMGPCHWWWRKSSIPRLLLVMFKTIYRLEVGRIVIYLVLWSVCRLSQRRTKKDFEFGVKNEVRFLFFDHTSSDKNSSDKTVEILACCRVRRKILSV